MNNQIKREDFSKSQVLYLDSLIKIVDTNENYVSYVQEFLMILSEAYTDFSVKSNKYIEICFRKAASCLHALIMIRTKKDYGLEDPYKFFMISKSLLIGSKSVDIQYFSDFNQASNFLSSLKKLKNCYTECKDLKITTFITLCNKHNQLHSKEKDNFPSKVGTFEIDTLKVLKGLR